jgi:hypothetical protein
MMEEVKKMTHLTTLNGGVQFHIMTNRTSLPVFTKIQLYIMYDYTGSCLSIHNRLIERRGEKHKKFYKDA